MKQTPLSEMVEIGQDADGCVTLLDIDKLIGSHLCVQANSGAGKSGAIRKLLEATHGRVQHIVIDTEDEFYTLREKFDYLIAGGDNGDCAATVNNAGALATTILESGVSAIVQINGLQFDDRCMFISNFLETMIAAPKRLWRPVLTVLDEAQFYAPEKGGPESLKSIISFMMLGRKRGFTGILATPRPADLSKRAMNPVNNWLIGRCGQPADRKSASDAIGFSPNSPEARGLRSLETRHFWAFGPALYLEPKQIRIGSTDTTIVKAGQATLPTPPAPAAMKRLLDQLNAAAKPVEAKDSEDPKVLHAEIARLTAELAKPTRSTIAQTEPDAAAIAAADRSGYERGFDVGFSEAEGQGVVLWEASRKFAIEHAENIAQQLRQGRFQIVRNPAVATTAAAPLAPMHVRASPNRAPAPAAAGDGTLSPALQNALNAVAWWHKIGHDPVERARAAVVARLSPKASTFGVYLAELAKRELVQSPAPGKVSLTDTGRRLAVVPRAGTAAEIREMAMSLLGPQEQKAFDVVYGAHPRSIARKSVAERMGLSPTASTTGVYLAAIAGYGIIENAGPGEVRAAGWLFP